MSIDLIVATDEVYGIGKDNQIPWHKTDDLRFFKKQAELPNTILVCGTNTYKSLPIKPFINRKMCVLSNSLSLTNPNHLRFTSIDDIFEHQKTERLLIIGGSYIYSQFLHYASKIYWTKIPGIYDCDTFFPLNLNKLRVLNKVKLNEELVNYELTLL